MTKENELASALLLYLSGIIKELGDDFPEVDGVHSKFSADREDLLVSFFKDTVDKQGLPLERVWSITMEFPLRMVLLPVPQDAIRELLVGYVLEWSEVEESGDSQQEAENAT